jgi:hypothetical protein
MNSRLRVGLSEFSEGRWATEPSMDPPIHPTELELVRSKRSSRVKRGVLALARFLIIFGIGVGGTLAWQSHGDAARAKIANLAPQFAWLAPQTAPGARAASAASDGVSADQLVAISRGLAVVRQSVDKLAADITKLQTTKQEAANRASAPPPAAVAAPGRKPVSPAPPAR